MVSKERITRGMTISITFGDVSFKAEVIENFPFEETISVTLEEEWIEVIKKIKDSGECSINYKNSEGKYVRIGMTLERVEIDKNPPIIHLRLLEKVTERGELRRHTRIDTFTFTTVSSNENMKIDMDATSEATIVDISKGGCLLLSSEEYHLESKLQLVFTLLVGSRPISTKGCIKSCRKSPKESSSYYGIEFTDLTPDDEESLNMYFEGIGEDNDSII